VADSKNRPAPEPIDIRDPLDDLSAFSDCDRFALGASKRLVSDALPVVQSRQRDSSNRVAPGLFDLVKELRHAVPARAPMEIAERVQHCIVRLEILAECDPLPDDAQHAFLVGQALLKTCQRMFPSK
jgi:hypothetical protein